MVMLTREIDVLQENIFTCEKENGALFGCQGFSRWEGQGRLRQAPVCGCRGGAPGTQTLVLRMRVG